MTTGVESCGLAFKDARSVVEEQTQQPVDVQQRGPDAAVVEGEQMFCPSGKTPIRPNTGTLTTFPALRTRRAKPSR